MTEKYDTRRLFAIMLILGTITYISYKLDAQPPKTQSEYERWVDSLYQINIQIAIAYGKALDTNPNAVRPEPAIWFLDMNGNMYDYPPNAENDSILRERAAYKRRLDSLGGRQFKELEEWYKNKYSKK